MSPVKVITPVPETVRSLMSVVPVPTAPILVVEVPALRVTSLVLPPAVPAIAPTEIAPLVVSTVKSASLPKVKPPVANVIDLVEVMFLKVPF